MKEAAGPSIFSERQKMFQESERSADPLLLSDLGKFHFGGVMEDIVRTVSQTPVVWEVC